MTLLNPWPALFAALVAVPLLVLLYVLKLRRRRLRIASTMLWRRSFEDHQANVPFQRLRISTLFLIQLLVLVLLLLALAEPVLEPTGASASRVILLIDRSASMNAIDAGARAGTRLAAAKQAAREIVDRISRGGGRAPVMIIAFAAQPHLVTGFESRRDVLLDAIDAIEPTDEEADLAAALRLSGTFAAQGEDEGDRPPDVVLISDGGVAPPEEAGFPLRGGQFRYVAVGAPVDNVGIVALSARRDYDDPSKVLALVRVLNAGPEPIDTLLTLFVDDAPGPIERVRIEAAGAPDDSGRATPPGLAAVSFAIDLPVGAVLSARHAVRDALPADDTAAVVLPPPARPRIAIVRGAEPDPYLADLLEETEPRSLRPMSADAFDALEPAEVDSGQSFDLVVFDGAAPRRMPGIPTLSFGATPPGLETRTATRPGGRRILSWRRQHALMRHVSLDPVVYAGFGGYRLPADAVALATGPDGPLIALFPAQSAQHVAVGFRLRDSNWPTHLSVAVFLQNVLDYLTLSRSGQASMAVRPGEAVTVRAAATTSALVVDGPGGRGEEFPLTIPVEPGRPTTLPVFRRVGLYTVDGAETPHEAIAVSVLSEVESDLRPARTIVVNAESVAAGAVAEAAPRGIWPWFAALALAGLVMEWLAYCRLLRV